MTDAIDTNTLGQDEYMKLFMQELTYQDPLKPVDNREFMAQMAQFSTLQQVTSTNDYLKGLLGMTNANQGLALLGKNVQFDGSEGTVINVKFNDKNPTTVSVLTTDNKISEIELKYITEVEAPNR